MGFLHRKFLGVRESEFDSVVRNLQHIIESRRGSGSFLRDFGLSDAGQRTPEDTISTLTAEIGENVNSYEPRVELVGVEEAYGDEGELRLDLKVRLRSTSEVRNLHFTPQRKIAPALEE